MDTEAIWAIAEIPTDPKVRALVREFADGVERLTRDLATARAEADRLNAYHEVWQRTKASWEAENARLRAACKDAAFALDGVIDGDFEPTGKTVRSALATCIDAIRDGEQSLPAKEG
jgi:hypothetical protein